MSIMKTLRQRKSKPIIGIVLVAFGVALIVFRPQGTEYTASATYDPDSVVVGEGQSLFRNDEAKIAFAFPEGLELWYPGFDKIDTRGIYQVDVDYDHGITSHVGPVVVQKVWKDRVRGLEKPDLENPTSAQLCSTNGIEVEIFSEWIDQNVRSTVIESKDHMISVTLLLDTIKDGDEEVYEIVKNSLTCEI